MRSSTSDKTYHSFAEQLEDLYQQHTGHLQRHQRLRDLPEDTLHRIKLSTCFKLHYQLLFDVLSN